MRQELTRIVNEVSTGRDTNAVGVHLLRAVVHNTTGVSNCLIFWNALNFGMHYNKNCVSTLLTRFQVALGHHAKVFTKGGLPDLGGSQIVH